MSNTNGLIASSDVAGSGNADSVFFIRKGDPVVIDDLVANNITCDTLDLNGGLLTTTGGGTTLTLNGVPLGGGIATITGTAPINVTAGQNPVISLANSGVVAGTYPLADVTVNSQGLIATINAGTIPPNDDWSSFPAQTAVNMNNFKITTLATPTVATDGANKGYVDGAITTAGLGFVNLLTNQTIAGIKTFTDIPVCATMPTANDQLANKQYVDNAVSADALANVLIAGNSAGANQINMNNNKIINCLNPTDPQDVATKSYVDGAGGAYLPLAGGTMASASATINMNGADLTNAGSVTAGGITETAQFGSAITPMFAFGAYATDITIGHYNPLTSMTLTSANDMNITAVEDINLQSKDINLTQSDITSFMNLTATGGIVIGAGLGVDITGGTTIQINSAGNVSIGSGNVLGADTEIEKIAFKDNEIYKVAGNADITIEDVASITNVGTAPNGAMLIQSEQDLTLNSTAGKVNIESLNINGTTINGAGVNINTSGAGLVDITSADVSITATTGTIVINSQASVVEVENVTFALTGSPATGTTISTANSGRDININTQTTGDFNVSTGGNARLQIDGATNGNTTFTTQGQGWVQINQATGTGGSAQPILKLQNTNATSGSVYVESYKDKNIANGDNLFVVGVFGDRTSGAKTEMARIETAVQSSTLNAEEIAMRFYVRDSGNFPSGTLAQMEINGTEGQINFRLPLDVNINDIIDIQKIALNGKTSFGSAGQFIMSRGSGGSALWANPSQTLPIGNYGGGATIDDTTPYVIGCSTNQPTFAPSPAGRYKVEYSAIIEGVNLPLVIQTQVVYNGLTYGGEIFNNGDWYISEPLTKSGSTHHSITFTDYVSFPYTYGASLNLQLEIAILTESGSGSTNDGRITATISPAYA